MVSKNDDAISRSAVLESAELISWYHVNQNGKMVSGASSCDEAYVKFSDVIAVLDAAKALDVAPVVRCVECKYRCTLVCPMYHMESYCDDSGFCDDYDVDHTDDDGFCHLGERRDGEAE